jgi:hypothetical protein
LSRQSKLPQALRRSADIAWQGTPLARDNGFSKARTA